MWNFLKAVERQGIDVAKNHWMLVYLYNQGLTPRQVLQMFNPRKHADSRTNGNSTGRD